MEKNKVNIDNNIDFDDGYKSFKINGDENKIIRFNPTDLSIVKRGKAVTQEIDDYLKMIKKDIDEKDHLKSDEIMEKADLFIREKINYIFDNDVADIVFGSQSTLSTLNGDPLFYRFLMPIMKLIESTVQRESKMSQEKVSKYESELNKYKTKEFLSNK